jgi:hypothetical protein
MNERNGNASVQGRRVSDGGIRASPIRPAKARPPLSETHSQRSRCWRIQWEAGYCPSRKSAFAEKGSRCRRLGPAGRRKKSAPWRRSRISPYRQPCRCPAPEREKMSSDYSPLINQGGFYRSSLTHCNPNVSLASVASNRCASPVSEKFLNRLC